MIIGPNTSAKELFAAGDVFAQVALTAYLKQRGLPDAVRIGALPHGAIAQILERGRRLSREGQKASSA
jgi:sugar/nucleoside kinase (ribokinase family)